MTSSQRHPAPLAAARASLDPTDGRAAVVGQGVAHLVHQEVRVRAHPLALERIIGAGDLLIESAGESGQSRFGNVRKPEAVQNEIYRQIDDRRHGPRTAPPPMAPPPVAAAEAGPASAAPAQDEIATKIRELDALRRQGLVSDEEFEAKRRDLLDRM